MIHCIPLRLSLSQHFIWQCGTVYILTSVNLKLLLSVHTGHISAMIFSCLSHARLSDETFRFNRYSSQGRLCNGSHFILNMTATFNIFYASSPFSFNLLCNCIVLDYEHCLSASECTAVLWLNIFSENTDGRLQLLLLCCFRSAAGVDKVLMTAFP